MTPMTAVALDDVAEGLGKETIAEFAAARA
jgi:hypothetical protein